MITASFQKFREDDRAADRAGLRDDSTVTVTPAFVTAGHVNFLHEAIEGMLIAERATNSWWICRAAQEDKHM
jgi:hypothetical protein